MGMRDLVFVGVAAGAALLLSAGLLRSTASPSTVKPREPALFHSTDIKPVVADLDAMFRKERGEHGVAPAPLAPNLAVFRRLSLALTGTVPSLEAIRAFEALPAEGRLDAALENLLRDRRAADYLAERFARAYVGTEAGPFVLFRRRRFTTWLSDSIIENRPYDAIVRNLLTERGLWTDHPATNFVTVTNDAERERPDPERLGARVARAFLGVRLDCAQCHDHPFQPWKQADFQGLAAFFGGIHADLRGVREGKNDYQPLDRKTNKSKSVKPKVPYRPELLPKTGTPREQLAAWVIDARNPNLARATVNRVWALMFGRPLHEPVDDLPADGTVEPVLAHLAADFSAQGYDLRRLIRVIAATEAFRVDSAGGSSVVDLTADHDATWAAFPITRLRPEQVAGSIFQAASLTTLGPDNPWIARLATYTGTNDFVKRYGDMGEDEFDLKGGTIPQRLLLLNGDLVRDKTKPGLFNASTRVALQAPTDAKAVEIVYLTVLTRRPTAEESTYFIAKLAGTKGDDRKNKLTDLYWTLLNTTEFSWNH
jgi:hypothetical protein